MLAAALVSVTSLPSLAPLPELHLQRSPGRETHFPNCQHTLQCVAKCDMRPRKG
jgi:hypothetical protein